MMAAGVALPTAAGAASGNALGTVKMQTASSSTNFAGWVFGDTTAAPASISFKIPAITCTTATQGVALVDAVITGTTSAPSETAGGLLEVCESSTANYIPFLYVGGTETNLTNAVAPGDVLKLTVSVTATTSSATIADTNTTRKFSKTIKKAVGSTVLQEQFGDGTVAVSGTTEPIVKFATTTWSNGSINKVKLGAVTPSAQVNMKSGTTLKIATSALTPAGATANSFKTTWKHS